MSLIKCHLSKKFCSVPIVANICIQITPKQHFTVMRIITIIFFAAVVFSMEAKAQISLKTEYIGTSDYMYLPDSEDAKPEKAGGRGSSVVYQGSANIPFYMKKNENNRPTAWGIGISAAYASLDNQDLPIDMVSEIMNLQLGILHIRPISKKWSMMASIGGGIFTPFTDFSKIRWKNVLGSGGVIFIWHLRPNLDLGGGVAVNSSLGYPMVFPALYLNWRLDRKFKVNVSLADGVDLSAGYEFGEYFKLALAFEMSGQMALLERDGKDMIFSHQYMVTGLRPEVRIGKTGLSIFVMGGISAYRPVQYSDRTLKAMFASSGSYYFRVSPYASAGIRFGL